VILPMPPVPHFNRKEKEKEKKKKKESRPVILEDRKKKIEKEK
jgi:hypothetical protein